MSQTQTAKLFFDCDVCSEQHEVPLNMGFSMPDFVNKLLPWERDSRCQISPDWCIVDDTFYYIRGCLQSVIQGTEHVFSWGVWSTLSVADFDRTMELWSNPVRQSEPKYIGSLSNTLPTYAETRNLSTSVQTRGVDERPLIILNDPGHELFAEQVSGMPMERAIQLAKLVLHGQASNPWSHLCER